MSAASRTQPHRRRRALATAALTLALGLLLAQAAQAATAAPRLAVHSMPHPTVFTEANNSRCEGELSEPKPRVCDTYQVTVTNLGSKSSDGSTVTVKDTLPEGLEARKITFLRQPVAAQTEVRAPTACSLITLSCKYKSEEFEGTVRTGILKPDETIEMEIYVTVKAGASNGPLTNSATVTGGGSVQTSASSVNQLAEPFAISLPAISRHLKVLEKAGLITRGREAQWRPCRLNPGQLKTAADWLDYYRRFWEESFDRLEDYLQKLKFSQTKTKPKEKNHARSKPRKH